MHSGVLLSLYTRKDIVKPIMISEMAKEAGASVPKNLTPEPCIMLDVKLRTKGATLGAGFSANHVEWNIENEI
jgi:hypothetical protein